MSVFVVKSKLIFISFILTLAFVRTPLAFGQQTVEESKPNAETAATESTEKSDTQRIPEAQKLEKAQQFYEEKLGETEATFGAFHTSITENMINLGLIYRAQGDHQKARNAFERSLEVHRINFGLHGEAQFPIVEQLIMTNRQLEEWEEVNKKYEYLYWLHRRVFGEESPQLLPMLDRLVMWKVEAINGQLFGARKILLAEALGAAKTAKLIVKQHPELVDEQGVLRISEDDLRRAQREQQMREQAIFRGR